ncbi:MAG TPA: crosslink repair DNA glycosylase YcaQ family protein, partial [Symbiobacteriaceae bacterium]|nr:crosslink repair DNA glycosylase YcaQ family protein [Symbiobacteriaceae bacterium]
QARGEIRRVPENGRLDQQRYAYVRWAPNPLKGFTLTQEEAHVELARRYFRWIGPATLAEFQWFSGLGVGAAKAAVAPLGLVPVDVGALMFADEVAAYEAFTVPDEPQVRLVSGLDSMLLLRRDVPGLLSPAHREHPVYGEKGELKAGGLIDSPYHVILDRGRLIGFWEFDPERQEIAWMTFDAPPAGLRAEVARTEAFAREQLGDVRSFSLDSPASRAPRIAWLRKQ